MNEVSGQLPTAALTRSASSKGAVDVSTASAETGKKLPVTEELPEQKKADTREASPQDLQDAVAQMNEFVQSERRDLQFSVDETSGQTVVKVMDRDSGDIIRQIPNEVFLELARNVQENDALNLINVQG